MRESRESRADRLRERAEAKQSEALRTLDTAHDMASIIPLGQPILVGHHSEGRDRRYRERIGNKVRKGIELSGYADDLERRAEAAESNTAIYADAEDPVAEIDARIAELEAKREAIRARPHESYQLSNIGANIRRLKIRRDQLATLKASPRIERMVGAVKVVEDPDLARIQLIYPGKPDEATRDKLKANGFRWAPSENAWQRQLNNAGRAAAHSVLGGD